MDARHYRYIGIMYNKKLLRQTKQQKQKQKKKANKKTLLHIVFVIFKPFSHNDVFLFFGFVMLAGDTEMQHCGE